MCICHFLFDLISLLIICNISICQYGMLVNDMGYGNRSPVFEFLLSLSKWLLSVILCKFLNFSAPQSFDLDSGDYAGTECIDYHRD